MKELKDEKNYKLIEEIEWKTRDLNYAKCVKNEEEENLIKKKNINNI